MSSRGKMPCSLKLLPRKNHLLRIRNPARRDLAQLPITPGVNLVLVKGGSGTSRSKPAQKAAGHPPPDGILLAATFRATFRPRFTPATFFLRIYKPRREPFDQR